MNDIPQPGDIVVFKGKPGIILSTKGFDGRLAADIQFVDGVYSNIDLLQNGKLRNSIFIYTKNKFFKGVVMGKDDLFNKDFFMGLAIGALTVAAVSMTMVPSNRRTVAVIASKFLPDLSKWWEKLTRASEEKAKP